MGGPGIMTLEEEKVIYLRIVKTYLRQIFLWGNLILLLIVVIMYFLFRETSFFGGGSGELIKNPFFLGGGGGGVHWLLNRHQFTE